MKKYLLAFFLFFSFFQLEAQRINKTKVQNLYDRIKAAGIRHPEFVIAQSMQETGI